MEIVTVKSNTIKVKYHYTKFIVLIKSKNNENSNFTGKLIAQNGNECTLLNGELHSFNDEPAVIKKDIYVWYKYGYIHRDKKPAYIKNKTIVKYYQYGKKHREDGPAIYDKLGIKRWYFKDKLHRLDGPAVEYPNGDYEWRKNNKLHRLDGQAVYYKNFFRKYTMREMFFFAIRQAKNENYIMPEYYEQYNIEGKLQREDNSKPVIVFDKLYEKYANKYIKKLSKINILSCINYFEIR